MNWAVLKDGRTMLGFILSVLLSVGAIILAVNDTGYWVVLVVVALIVLFFSIAKADKVTGQEWGSCSMENQAYVNWGGHIISLSWEPYRKMEPADIVTSVHGYCFFEGKVVLVHVAGRGFNVPGGHIEAGESPEETLHREAYEEAYVKGDLTYIGAICVDHTENVKFMENGKYPRVGYQLFYRMDIAECLPFLREHETLTRIWVEPEEVRHVMDDHETALLVLKEAMNNKSESGVTVGNEIGN